MRGMTLDDALTRHIGEFGRGQLGLVLCASLYGIPNAMILLMWVFMAYEGPGAFVCTDGPQAAACQQALVSGNAAEAICSLSPDAWRWADPGASVVSQFNLLCGRRWMVQLANSITFAGCLVGSGIFGCLCDALGRKLPLLISTLIAAAATLVSMFSTSYTMLVALKAVAGAGAAGQVLSVFLLAAESVGTSWRGSASIITLVMFAVGEFVLVGVAYGLPHWRHLALTAGCVNLTCLAVYPWLLESPRWLLSRGRREEAMALLRKLALRNGTRMPDELLIAQASSSSNSSSSSSRTSDKYLRLCSILGRPQVLHRVTVLALLWFASMISYYGISLGSGGIPGSLYMVFALGALAELVAIAVAGVMFDRVGRHLTIATGILLCGLVSLVCALTHNKQLQTALASLGKFGCSVALSVISMYTAELFPTTIRSTMMGLLNVASRLGAISAPFVLMAGQASGSSMLVPFLVFGVSSVLAGLAMLTMPETQGTPMPESMEDLDCVLSVFTARPWRQGCWATIAFMFRTHGFAAGSRRGSSESRDASISSRSDCDGSAHRWRGPSLADVEVAFGSTADDAALSNCLDPSTGAAASKENKGRAGDAAGAACRLSEGEDTAVAAGGGDVGTGHVEPAVRITVHVMVGEGVAGSEEGSQAGDADK